MSLDVLLEILRSLESLATEVALMRLEWDMDADVRCDVIALDGCDAARAPVTSQVEVVCALATDVTLAYVFLMWVLEHRVAMRWKSTYVECLSSLMTLTTVQPLASE